VAEGISQRAKETEAREKAKKKGARKNWQRRTDGARTEIKKV